MQPDLRAAVMRFDQHITRGHVPSAAMLRHRLTHALALGFIIILTQSHHNVSQACHIPNIWFFF